MHTGGESPPAEYITYALCVMLSCLPSQLKGESIIDVQAFLACHNVQQEMEEMKGNSGLGMATRGSGEVPAELKQYTVEE